MNTLSRYDTLESLIFELGLRISSIEVDKTQNVMNVLLNSYSMLRIPISKYPFFDNVSQEHLSNYELIADGIGVHWPDIDEDLSLKGFLKEELKKLVGLNDKKPDGSGGSSNYAMAA